MNFSLNPNIFLKTSNIEINNLNAGKKIVRFSYFSNLNFPTSGNNFEEILKHFLAFLSEYNCN